MEKDQFSNMTPRRFHKFKDVVHCRQPNLSVVLEDVHDRHNISAVMRTCDSVGIMEISVLYQETPVEKLLLGKKSAGSAQKWVDVKLYNDAHNCMAALRKKYDKVYCTHLSEDAVPLYDLDLTGSVALVFGNERSGISQEMLNLCDGNFIIPQVGMVESLNISVACAVSLYEAYRQRKAAGWYDKSQFTPQAEQALFDEYLERKEANNLTVFPALKTEPPR